MLSENCAYSLSDEIWELIVCSFKKIAAGLNNASSSLELAFAIERSGVLHFRKRNANRVYKLR